MDGLQITLELAREDAIHGESVPFLAVVSHTFRSPMSVISLKPEDRALRLFMRKIDGEERCADAFAPIERDGLDFADPDRREAVTLLPGEKLELRGDLLRWFGHIPAGTYKVWAEYEGIMRMAVSEPASLKVLPATILAANTPRWGLQDPDSPYTAAWAHRHERGIMLFYQLQSPAVPRNPLQCVRAGIISEQVSAHAACLPCPDFPVGHLYWFTVKERFFFVPFDVRNAVPGPAVEVRKLPFKGWPVASGLSLKDGSFLVPFLDYRRTRFALVHVKPTGEATAVELDLGKNAPAGPNLCFFEKDVRLHFLWTKAKGRQIDYAMLPLDDLAAGFATRTVHITNDPVLWFDAYLDRGVSAVQLMKMYLAEPGKPEDEEEEEEEALQAKVMVWCVTSKEGRVVCTPVSATDSAVLKPVAFSGSGAVGLSVLGSVVTSENGLALLFVDDGGRLFYASTMRRRLMPLDELTGIPVTQAQYPSLMRGSTYPWVHLRFVTNARMISYVRLEPENEPDPVESETRPWDMETALRETAPDEQDGEEEGR